MLVSTAVVSAVAVSTTSLNFGSVVIGSNVSASATITVNATNGSSYIVTINEGLRFNPATGRGMSGSVDGGTYDLYKDPGFTQFWGNTDFGGIAHGTGMTGTGTGANQTLTVYGGPYGAGSTPGSYSDIVLVTVIY